MRKIACLITVLLLVVSCSGKKEVKQVSQESSLAQAAFALAEKIKVAFGNKDLTTLKDSTSDEGFKDITAGGKVFDSVDLNFTPRWVEIQNNQVYLNIAWKSKWITSGRSAEDRGMAVFVMEGSPLRVTKILRANPFIYPEL